MNKNDKNKINHAIGLLEHAVGSLKSVSISGFREGGISLLTNMQQITIEIGNIIEEKERGCTAVIKKLEALCEIYYQCSLTIGNKKDTEKQCACIQKYILQVKEDIRNIPVKTEILFLPYQVSMWDSLESIWKAAKEDKQTDCYVVPIPVYDVMSDNSLGELHYDGALYPNDVTITSYLEYDIERRHPDVIFFHNPYDDINTVTRVPEPYYSRNLKKYTDLLVYIPYYVTGKGGPAEHQCHTPGILFADHVVVQPGIIYERICRIYTNFIKQNGWEHVLKKAEDKFLPLGSPKFDKLLQTKCDLAALPKQWRTAIQKADGSIKKIVLYNLSITSLLENNEKMLNKISDVLAKFKKVRDEVTLLWRPHPLLKKTIASMRPWLRDAYENIIQQYQEEGWGIFDETPDSNLAMMLSDAYYGDFSSLLISYQILNKPILLQNADSQCFASDDSKMQLWFFWQPIMADGEIWFTSWDMNGLYRFPLLNGQICNKDIQTSESFPGAVLETKFENESDLQEALYSDLIQYNDLLIFPPFHAKSIAVYHIKAKNMNFYTLPEQIAKIDKGKYHTGFVYGHFVYFIGAFSDIEMMRLNMDTRKVELCGCIPDQVGGMNMAEKIGYCTLMHHKLLIPLVFAHAIVEYDIKTEKTRLKMLPKEYSGQLKGIFNYAEDELLLLVGSKVVSWNFVNESFNEITEYLGIELDRLVVIEKKVYIFGLWNQMVYVYDLESGKKESINCMHGNQERGVSGRTKMFPVCFEADHLIIFSLFYNKFIFIQDGQIIKEVELFTTNIPDIDYNEVLCHHIKTEARFFQCSLEHYLNYILSRKRENEAEMYETVGEKIYQILCK